MKNIGTQHRERSVPEEYVKGVLTSKENNIGKWSN